MADSYLYDDTLCPNIKDAELLDSVETELSRANMTCPCESGFHDF